MKGIIYTSKTSGNAAFFALLELQVPAQEVHSLYPELTKQVNVFCEEYSDIIQTLEGMHPDRDVEFCMDLKDEQASPPPPCHYRLCQVEPAEVRKQLADLLKRGWVHPSCSLYGVPILCVQKRTGDLRMCMDFRMLNQQTQLDVFLILRIVDMLDKLGRASVFSTMDLGNPYHQVRIHKPHVHRMEFFTLFRQYEFTVLPFGLTNAPNRFQCIMNTTFSDITQEVMLVYLDNIPIYGKDESEHLEHIKAVIQRFRDRQFKVKRSKCKFAVDTIKYLAHIVSKGKVSVDPDKTDTIRSWLAPTYVKQVQQFLGLANYYNQFIKQFAQTTSPLTKLL